MSGSETGKIIAWIGFRVFVLGILPLLVCSCQTTQAPDTVETREPPIALVTGPEPVSTPESLHEPKPVASTEPEKLEAPLIAGIARQAELVEAKAERLDDKHWIVRNKLGRELILEESSRRAALDGVTLFLNEPFKRKLGGFALSDSDFESVLVASMLKAGGDLRSKTIAIDPGHGGSERGARNEDLNVSEKDLNLDVSNRLKEELEELGYKVILTRYDDRPVALEERSLIANRAKAGLFVSIHFNAATNKEAMGLETYVLTPPGAASTGDDRPGEDAHSWPGNDFDGLNFELGYSIQKGLVEDLQRVDRGFKKARFKALKGLECPGALVECGFLSHSKEALLVNTPVYRQKLAESLAKSIDAFAKPRLEEGDS